VRWIVEKTLAAFNHHSALTNIRNSEMGHIMVDYRICAAMLNFVHKPVTADGQNARKVAVRIHRQVATSAAQNNPLSFLLNKRLDTKLIKRQNLSEINDFPRLKKKVMEQKIFLGTYQYRQSKSYMNDLIKSETAYVINTFEITKITDRIFKEKLLQILSSQEKLVAAEIISIHHHQTINNPRSTKQSDNYKNVYRVFVKYNPSSINYKAITGNQKFLTAISVISFI
jgi:hypothetical protein